MHLMHPMLAQDGGFDLQQIIFVAVFVLIGFIQWLFKLWQQKREAAELARRPPPSAEEIEARRRAWKRQAGSGHPTTDSPEEVNDLPSYSPQQSNGPVSAPSPSGSKPPPLPSTPPSPSNNPIPPFAPKAGGLGDLIETFRKAVEEAQQPQKNKQPPPPDSPYRSAQQTARSSPSPLPQTTEVAMPAYPSAESEDPIVHIRHDPNLTSQPKPYQLPVAHAEIIKQQVDSYEIKSPQQHSRQKNAHRRPTHPLAEILRDAGGYRKAFILKEVLDAPKALQKSPWPVE